MSIMDPPLLGAQIGFLEVSPSDILFSLGSSATISHSFTLGPDESYAHFQVCVNDQNTASIYMNCQLVTSSPFIADPIPGTAVITFLQNSSASADNPFDVSIFVA